MSMQDLIAAAAAQNALTARMNDFVDSIDDKVADLTAVIKGQMNFTGTIDPDFVTPTNVDGGTFTTIASFVAAAPIGAYLVATLAPGKTHVISGAHIELFNQTLNLVGSAANKPKIVNMPFVQNGFNSLASIVQNGLSKVSCSNLNIEMIAPAADAALPWTSVINFCGQRGRMRHSLALSGCKITATALYSVASAGGGSIVDLHLFDTEFSGPFVAITQETNGLVLIAKQTVTLSNGATLTSTAGTTRVLSN